QPRPSCEQIRTRVLKAAARRAGERVTAYEREAWRQRSCGRDDFALRAAGIGDDRRLSHVLVELVEQRDVLLHRGVEDDDVGFGEDDQIVGRDVDGVHTHRRLEDVLVVDGDDERRRPELAHRLGDRSADETEANDADLLENRRLRLARPARLYDRKFHRHFRFQISDAEIHHLKSNLQSAIRNQQYQLPHPRRFTGSRQMLRPMAGAMMRSSAISRSNCDGNSDCAPSLSAWSGSSWTSMINPSAPAATAARAMGTTMSRRPAPWLGSATIGK